MTKEEIETVWKEWRLQAFAFQPFAAGGYFRVYCDRAMTLPDLEMKMDVVTFYCERTGIYYRVLGRHDGVWIEVEHGEWRQY